MTGSLPASHGYATWWSTGHERGGRRAGRSRDVGAPKKPRSGPTAERRFSPRVSVYVLRHTCATLLLLDTVDLLTVSRRLRHKNISITARFYGHVKAEHTTKAAESFNRLASSV
jgi:integrase